MPLCETVAAGDHPTLVFGKRYSVEFRGGSGGVRRCMHFYFMRSSNFEDRYAVAFIAVVPADDSDNTEEWNEIDNIKQGDSLVIDALYENSDKLGSVLLELNNDPTTFTVRKIEYGDYHF
jgi:hypothetical protein